MGGYGSHLSMALKKVNTLGDQEGREGGLSQIPVGEDHCEDWRVDSEVPGRRQAGQVIVYHKGTGRDQDAFCHGLEFPCNVK